MHMTVRSDGVLLHSIPFDLIFYMKFWFVL